jgi:hypothetical protein
MLAITHIILNPGRGANRAGARNRNYHENAIPTEFTRPIQP